MKEKIMGIYNQFSTAFASVSNAMKQEDNTDFATAFRQAAKTNSAKDLSTENGQVGGKGSIDGEEALLASIRKSEGEWDTVGDIGDGAGLSVGAYQMTEKSGGAQQLAKRLGISNYSKLSRNQRATEFKSRLATDEGKKIQTQLAKDRYFTKPKKLATKLGISDPKVISFMIDTHLNGGLDSVIRRAKGDYSLENMKKARKARYKYLASSKPRRFSKYLKGWLDRVDRFN